MHSDRFKRVSVSHRPRCTNLSLHVGDEYVGDKVVACHAGENGVDVVLVDRGGALHIFREDSGFDADVVRRKTGRRYYASGRVLQSRGFDVLLG